MAKIDQALRVAHLHAKSERSMSLGAIANKFPNLVQPVFGNTLKNRNLTGSVTPLTVTRPLTCFGLVPTPQVSMGACFFNILHDCKQKVNCCAAWTHPANHKQYLIIGTEEGIFTLDLCEMHENTLNLVNFFYFTNGRC